MTGRSRPLVEDEDDQAPKLDSTADEEPGDKRVDPGAETEAGRRRGCGCIGCCFGHLLAVVIRLEEVDGDSVHLLACGFTTT
jgi:hypothetical protein